MIELCNPGNGEDLNEMTSNVNKVKKRYKELFLQPIQGLVAEIDTKIEDKNSPIMETMQLVNLNSFAKDSNQTDKKLIIVSDLIQNTNLINMYQMNKLNFKEFKKKFDYQKTKTNLQDATVEVLFLSRKPKIQTQQLIDFWEQYFLDNNSSLISLDRLEG